MPYTPDPRQRLQRATRFFARVVSFDLECPACGEVISIRRHAETNSSKRTRNLWDPTTSRLRCPAASCGKVYVLGLLAWPVAATPKVASQTPADQIPNLRQLAQLRAEGGGWWLDDAHAQRFARPAETNLTTEPTRPTFEEDDDDA